MQFYVSKNHSRLNGRPFSPEKINPHLCLNPTYSTNVEAGTNAKVLLDSGAFQDRAGTDRLTFKDALERQIKFMEARDFTAELVVSYDRLVDESMTAIGRNKKRVAHPTAKKYVKETIDAAKYLADNRDEVQESKLILSCQGVTTPQYIGCLKEVARFAEKGDVIGFGGFCIIGQQPSIRKQFFKTLGQALPELKKRGIKRAHFFGVGYFPVLTKANVMCRQAGILPSYDTSSYEFNGVMGRVFDPTAPGMSGVFDKDDKKHLYHPRDLALLNIKLVSDFWDHLNAITPFGQPLPEEDVIAILDQETDKRPFLRALDVLRRHRQQLDARIVKPRP